MQRDQGLGRPTERAAQQCGLSLTKFLADRRPQTDSLRYNGTGRAGQAPLLLLMSLESDTVEDECRKLTVCATAVPVERGQALLLLVDSLNPTLWKMNVAN